MHNLIRKLRYKIVLLIVVAIMVNLPAFNKIICVEADGSTSIETALLGSCKVSHVSEFDGHDHEQESYQEESHSDCFDCTDITILEPYALKFQNEGEFNLSMDLVIDEPTPGYDPIFAEPCIAYLSNPYVPNKVLHQHVETVILLI